ncbi:hypothetical protein Tco_1394038 [Tanacetum coccineum]
MHRMSSNKQKGCLVFRENIVQDEEEVGQFDLTLCLILLELHCFEGSITQSHGFLLEEGRISFKGICSSSESSPSRTTVSLNLGTTNSPPQESTQAPPSPPPQATPQTTPLPQATTPPLTPSQPPREQPLLSTNIEPLEFILPLHPLLYIHLWMT